MDWGSLLRGTNCLFYLLYASSPFPSFSPPCAKPPLQNGRFTGTSSFSSIVTPNTSFQISFGKYDDGSLYTAFFTCLPSSPRRPDARNAARPRSPYSAISIHGAKYHSSYIHGGGKRKTSLYCLLFPRMVYLFHKKPTCRPSGRRPWGMF